MLTDSFRICGYRYCENQQKFEYNTPLEITEATSLSILTLLNAFMVVYFWRSFHYFVTLKTNLALSNNKEAFSVFSRIIIFGLQIALILRFLINMINNPLTVVIIVSNLSESQKDTFELIFMILRGFLAPFRDFTELNLLCYLIRLQDAKKGEMEVGSGMSSGKSKPFFKQVGLMSSELPPLRMELEDYATNAVYQTT